MPVINEYNFPLLPSRAAKRPKRPISSHARKPRVSIDDLPDELILEILSYLPGIDIGDFQLPALLSLALTNQLFYRLVIEKIYLAYDSHFCQPYLLLRTMISHPQLADFVQNVNMTQGPQMPRGNVSYLPTARDKRIIKEGLRILAIPGWKHWVAACNGDRITDETVHNAILLHTPNIASLSVEDVARAETRCPSWVDLISKASAGNLRGRSHCFEHLRSIKVDIRSATLSQLAPLFRLQALRYLQLRNISENGMGTCIDCDECHGKKQQIVPKLQRLIPQACNRLEMLSLEHTFYCMEILEVLLASPSQLKSFNYEVSLDHISEAYIEEDLTIATILRHQRTSLENLNITCDPLAEEETSGDIHLHDSLVDFISLKHITCPLGMIAPVYVDPLADRLPPLLLTLHTTIRRHTSDQGSLSELEQMAAYHQPLTTQLEEVRVIAPQSAKWLKYDWARLVSPFAEAGISFVIQNEYEDEDDLGDDWDDASTASSRSSDEVDLYSDED